jgi:hypothetical protein
MLTEEEAVQCFDGIVNCKEAYDSICEYFRQPMRPRAVPLVNFVKKAVFFAKLDWNKHFSGREPQPAWRRHDVITYQEQIIDLVMEHEEQFT